MYDSPLPQLTGLIQHSETTRRCFWMATGTPGDSERGKRSTDVKILIIGSSGAGKSSLAQVFVGQKFQADLKSTVGSDFFYRGKCAARPVLLCKCAAQSVLLCNPFLLVQLCAAHPVLLCDPFLLVQSCAAHTVLLQLCAAHRVLLCNPLLLVQLCAAHLLQA
jgi:hypothetical protein